MRDLDIFGLEFEKNIVMSCLKLALSNLYNCKIFGLEFQTLSYLKPALSNLTKMSF